MLLNGDLGNVPIVFGLNFAHCPKDLNSYLFLAGLKGLRRDISDGSNFDIFPFSALERRCYPQFYHTNL